MVKASGIWIFFLSFVLCIPLPALAEYDWKITAEASFDTGKYGTDTRTDTLYLPLTVKRYFSTGDVSLTLPYIFQRSSGIVTVQEGAVFKTKPKAAQTNVKTRSGVGDVLLKGSYYLLDEGKNAPLSLYAVGKIKFPTADDKKGLGTGEFDEGAGLELSKKVTDGTSLFADFYYTIIGAPTGTNLNNRFFYDIGVSKELSPGYTLTVLYEDSTPLQSGNAHLRDIAATIEYRVTKDTRVFGGVTAGLTSSSPQAGLNAGVSVLF